MVNFLFEMLFPPKMQKPVNIVVGGLASIVLISACSGNHRPSTEPSNKHVPREVQLKSDESPDSRILRCIDGSDIIFEVTHYGRKTTRYQFREEKYIGSYELPSGFNQSSQQKEPMVNIDRLYCEVLK